MVGADDVPGAVIWVTSQTAYRAKYMTYRDKEGCIHLLLCTDVQCGDTNSVEIFYSGTPDVEVLYEGDAVNEVTICVRMTK